MARDRVPIAQLKAHLAAHLRSVRGGRSLVILDRDVPVARLVPYESTGGAVLAIRRPTTRLQDVALPRPVRGPLDSLAALAEERGSR